MAAEATLVNSSKIKDASQDVDQVMAVKENEVTDQEEETTCPLFMTGLPTDFGTNPQLAALASLLDDNDCDEKEEKGCSINTNNATMPLSKHGGGKIDRKLRRRQGRRHEPYPTTSMKGKKKTTLGEAQLFLNMWSLK